MWKRYRVTFKFYAGGISFEITRKSTSYMFSVDGDASTSSATLSVTSEKDVTFLGNIGASTQPWSVIKTTPTGEGVINVLSSSYFGMSEQTLEFKASSVLEAKGLLSLRALRARYSRRHKKCRVVEDSYVIALSRKYVPVHFLGPF